MAAPPSYLYSPRVSPVTASPTPFRISAARFAPTSPFTSSSPTRLLALASHHSPTSTVQLRHLDTSDDNDSPTPFPHPLDADLGRDCLSPPLSSLPLLDDIHSLAFLRPHLLAATSSTGHLHLLSTSSSPSPSPPSHKALTAPSLSLSRSLPLSPLPLNAVDAQSPTSPLIATAGDSSALTLLDLPTLTPLRTLPHSTTSSTLDLRFASHALYTATLNGSLLLFDVRSHAAAPSLIARSPARSPLLCLSPHPARPDTVVTGSAAGVVEVWDMRGVGGGGGGGGSGSEGGGRGGGPVSAFDVGGGCVNGLAFLPFDASTVVVATEGGGVWVVDYNRERRDPTEVDYQGEVGALALHRTGGGVRCIDVDRTSHTIVAGTDSQQLLHFQYLLS